MEQKQSPHVLEEMGLSTKEAEIYLSLLGKNRMSLAEITRASGIKRATCYEHLESLLRRNFVTRVPLGKRTAYAAVSPKKVLSDFKRRVVSVETKLQEMTALHEQAINKPRITFYEGKRELRHIYDDIFQTIGDVYSIFPPDVFFENFSEHDYDDFDRESQGHAFKQRDLYVASKHVKKIRNIRKKNGGANIADKVLPNDFKTNVDVLVFGDKVALISLRDLSAIEIENKDIADLFRTMHTFIWKHI